jgi:hypothetical protein
VVELNINARNDDKGEALLPDPLPRVLKLWPNITLRQRTRNIALILGNRARCAGLARARLGGGHLLGGQSLVGFGLNRSKAPVGNGQWRSERSGDQRGLTQGGGVRRCLIRCQDRAEGMRSRPRIGFSPSIASEEGPRLTSGSAPAVENMRPNHRDWGQALVPIRVDRERVIMVAAPTVGNE